MQQYTVTGMHCAACSASVEKAVKKVPGVESCAVSLLTNSMGVEGTAEPAAVIKAVEDAGYGASMRGQEAAPAADASVLEDRQTPHLKKRLIASVAFLLILMYFSMGHMMWGWPLPGWFSGNHVAMGLVQLLLAGIVMVINQEFFVSGTKSLLRGSPNMDTLVSLGAAASYGWSVYALFAMTDAQLHGGSEAAMAYMDEFYFESAAMILTLITVGKLLEAHSKGKTTDALKSLMALAPETATVIRDGKEIKIPAAQVRKGDVFVVRPGQSIPVDGIVLDGASAVNEAALTGESVPVDKAPGDGVSAATVNCSGFLRCEATRVGEDTTLSQIIRMVSDAAAMSLSSFCVVSNALRLNLCKLYSAKHDHKGKPMPEIHLAEQNKEDTGMTKTLHVKGMMCGHCEARVKKALEAVDGVASAVADHNNGTAVVTLTKDVSNETLKAAVEAQDYEVTGVE